MVAKHIHINIDLTDVDQLDGIRRITAYYLSQDNLTECNLTSDNDGYYHLSVCYGGGIEFNSKKTNLLELYDFIRLIKVEE